MLKFKNQCRAHITKPERRRPKKISAEAEQKETILDETEHRTAKNIWIKTEFYKH